MLTDGACGATSALMGNEISDMLRRLSACRCAAVLIDSGRAERVDAVFDVARCRAPGAPLRLGHESVSCRWTEPGRDGPGLADGDPPDVESRARLRPW